MNHLKPLAIVAGALAAKPGNGGHAWARVSFVVGLQRLGFDVVYVEQQPGAGALEHSYFTSICSQFHIEGFLLSDGESTALARRVAGAALLVNIGGHLTYEDIKGAARRRVYVDDDPGYTQLWNQAGLLDGRLDGHDLYLTFGGNIGHEDCSLPTGGFDWRPMLPPVVLDDWPVAATSFDRFTTVATWRGGYGRVEAGGCLYGQKAHEFRRFVDMPQLVHENFEIALDIADADSRDGNLLAQKGWRVVDPRAVASTPDDFRRYVQASGAEFSPAQGIYVETRTGWFSDRTTRYLASGKPALVQSTGLADELPLGDGLITFATVEQAVAGANAIICDYDAHARAARAFAEKHLDSDRVLGQMLEEAGL